MMRILRSLTYFSTKGKAYYPFFLAEDYTPLQYSPYYARKAATLNIQKPNIHQVLQTTLPKFLEKQIEEDKTLFSKQKQFLFVGRSNAGKSSLINAIFRSSRKAGKYRVARVAKRPGTTRFLHFHKIQGSDCLVVDAPGYGFAKMNKKRREMWAGLTEEYLKVSSRLSQIFICINFEHGLKQNDILFLKRADKFNVDIQIILTKVDKVSHTKYYYQLQSIVQGLKRLNLTKMNQRILAVSTKTKFGVDMVRMRVVEAIQSSIQRNIDHKQDLLLSYVKELRVQRAPIEKPQKQLSKQYLVRKLIYNSKLTKYLK